VVDKFPIKIFIDVEPESFKTGNKKHVTEDFVAENLKKLIGMFLDLSTIQELILL